MRTDSFIKVEKNFVGYGKRTNDMYAVEFPMVNENDALKAPEKEINMVDVWHMRPAHADRCLIKLMIDKNLSEMCIWRSALHFVIVPSEWNAQ